MLNLVALALIVLSSAHQPRSAGDPPSAQHVQRSSGPAASRLTPQKKAWFEHAIDDILEGKGAR